MNYNKNTFKGRNALGWIPHFVPHSSSKVNPLRDALSRDKIGKARKNESFLGLGELLSPQCFPHLLNPSLEGINYFN